VTLVRATKYSTENFVAQRDYNLIRFRLFTRGSFAPWYHSSGVLILSAELSGIVFNNAFPVGVPGLPSRVHLTATGSQ